MPLGSASAETERAELETVVAALERSPRLAKLLSFIGQKYLEGQSEELTEYNIATEVFGRARKSFDSTDSVARTEVYRLRKKLKEYYETEGRDHSIQILIPFRTYVPEFIRRGSVTASQQSDIDELNSIPAGGVAEAGDMSEPLQAETKEDIRDSGTRIGMSRVFLYGGVLLAVLALIGVGVYRSVTRRVSGGASAGSTPNSPSSPQPMTPPAHVAAVPLRLLAGYQGSPKIDSAGAYWEADRYFLGSAGFERPNTPVARTSDQMLYDRWRIGDFSYDIPLAPGFYELHLFFVAALPDDKTQALNVTANGQSLLTGFNISADALGANIADEKVFKDITPDKDGYLHLKFSTAVLNALEILPGLPHRQLPVRIVMQSSAVTDHSGNVWRPDTYFQNGVASSLPRQVSGTPDPELYTEERYGHFTYSIPVDARGRYTIILHFAELYWLPDDSGKYGPGSRVFRVYCNGTTLLDNFDIAKEAGSLRALTKTFSHIRPTPEGKLDLTFDPIVNNATISAIEVIDEGD